MVCVFGFSACLPACLAAERPSRPNIVLYVIDTLRADRLGLYGYDKSTSPNIDRIAASGVVFEQASAPAPWTLPSVTSMLLSQLPCEHRVLVDRDRIASGAEPLAVLLAGAGYRTGAFFANPYAGAMTGLDRGYEVAELVSQPNVEVRVSAWLDSLDDGPFFLYVHTVEPHNPEAAKDRFVEPVSAEIRARLDTHLRRYRTLTRVDYDAKRPLGTTDNTREQRELLRSLDELRESIDVLYDATVREADEGVGRLVAKLRAAGLWEDTLFVLVSDHGEELGDHGGWQHDQSVYEELLHVPMIVHFPRDERAGLRIREPVSLIDVVPTLTDYLHLAPELGFRGRSVLPLLEPGSAPFDARLTAVRQNAKKYYRPYKESRGDVNLVVRRGLWKGIWNVEIDTFELYHLGKDPLERNDLSDDEGKLSEVLRGLAQSGLDRCGEGRKHRSHEDETDLDEGTRRRLETLGYIPPEKP